MIILIGSEKGGTGKTTIATNLAGIRSSKGKNVLLLDTDIQKSATFWTRVRENANIYPVVHCAQLYGRIDREILKLAREYDDIIIDAGGRDSEELRSSMLVADRIYIPLQPSQFDIWTITPFLSMIQKASDLNSKLKSFIVFNRASTNPSVTEIDEAISAMKNLEQIQITKTRVRERIAYRKAVREGMTVPELKPYDPKAIEEMLSLYKEIFSK